MSVDYSKLEDWRGKVKSVVADYWWYSVQEECSYEVDPAQLTPRHLN